MVKNDKSRFWCGCATSFVSSLIETRYIEQHTCLCIHSSGLNLLAHVANVEHVLKRCHNRSKNNLQGPIGESPGLTLC